ncbi:MAG: DNA recombination protein RmuC [Coriobacteriales bacterium]|jgi:DNA recombination protein RmuC|nr:DNA recombination protein RmuC [Coriobacteriales bacterium]
MSEFAVFLILAAVAAVLVLAVLILQIVQLVQGRGANTSQEVEQLQNQLNVAQEQLALAQLKLEGLGSGLNEGLGRLDGLIREEFGRNREEALRQQQAAREESQKLQQANREETTKTLLDTREETRKSLGENREELAKQFKEVRETMEGRLAAIQNDNAVKLEEMRKTVDEKLQETVEKRFAESFTLISDRLEQVHKGLGEMQVLATDVGDLKKVLANVKTRGNLGEYQLAAILEQVLSPEQYCINAQTKKRSQERVEFAVRLPGQGDDGNSEVLLPIDSKFPIEEYERLLDAYEGKSSESPEVVQKRLVDRIKVFARTIRDKYLNPPMTTDFALLFLPTEGLYAEVLRVPGLLDEMQRNYGVIAVGPTNLVALLNSLQMGFRTLAIQKRSSEVWTLLGAVKTEFGKFAGVLEKVKAKLDSAAKEIDNVGTRTRAINRKLDKVQELPGTEAVPLLGDGEVEAEVETEVGTEVEADYEVEE